MLWIEPSVMFYAGCLGALFGCFVAITALKRNHKDVMKLLEAYWKQDISEIRNKIYALEQKNKTLSYILSTKSGDKHVNNKHKRITHKVISQQKD